MRPGEIQELLLRGGGEFAVVYVGNIDRHVVHRLYLEDHLIVARESAVRDVEFRDQSSRRRGIGESLDRAHDSGVLVAGKVQDLPVAVQAGNMTDQRVTFGGALRIHWPVIR